MANHIGTKLSRLIRERSYLSGEIERLEEAAQDLQREIEALRAKRKTKVVELKRVRLRLVEVDDFIRADAPNIDPNDINVVRRTPRQSTGAHGTLVGAVVALLRSNLDAVSTIEVAEKLAPEFGLPWTTAKGRDYTLSRVRRILNNLKERKAVARASAATGEHNQPVARWRWAGD